MFDGMSVEELTAIRDAQAEALARLAEDIREAGERVGLLEAEGERLRAERARLLGGRRRSRWRRF